MKIKKASVFKLDEKLSKSIAALLNGEETVVIVDKKGKYYGIIDDRNIRLGFKNPEKVKNETAAVRAPKIQKEELKNIEKVMMYFISGHFHALPVVDKKMKPVGIVTRIDVLNEMLKESIIPRISASSIMATPLYTIDANETFGRLKRLMKELNVHRFVVVEKKRIIGVVSSYDLLMFMEKPRARGSMQLITSVKNPDSLKVKQFIREKIIKVKTTDHLPDIVKKMVSNKITYAICTDNKNEAVGIITALDILKLVLKIITPKPIVFISGLYNEGMFYYDEIKSAIEKEVMKLSKFADIKNVNLHVKKGKSVYKMSLSLVMDDEPIHIHEEDHKILPTIDKIIKNLGKIAKKLKSKTTYKRK